MQLSYSKLIVRLIEEVMIPIDRFDSNETINYLITIVPLDSSALHLDVQPILSHKFCIQLKKY